MAVYWLAYLIPALLSLGKVRINSFGWWVISAALALVIGLRYQVGADWTAYLFHLARVGNLSLFEVLSGSDPGYYLINWVAASVGFDIWFVNLVVGTIYVVGLVRFVRCLPDPILAFALAIPYMTIVVVMGYSRQALALGFVLWGISHLLNGRYFKFLAFVAIAAACHKSAVILMPLVALSRSKNRIATIILVAATGLLLYVLFLAERVDVFLNTYVTSSYSQASEGGPIRVLMNALPAIIYLYLKGRIRTGERMEGGYLWYWMSLLSLLCLPFVLLFPTAVDRVAVYFMPIQLVGFCLIPLVFTEKSRVLVRLSVLATYGLVLFVWLTFSQTRTAWLPYQFWPLVS